MKNFSDSARKPSTSATWMLGRDQQLAAQQLMSRWPTWSLMVVVFLLGILIGGLKQQEPARVHMLAKPVNRTIMDADLSALDRLNQQLTLGNVSVPECEPTEFGKGWGGHHLCKTLAPSQPCHFYSFGVANDYSFDVAIANTWGCRGFAADPTIVHNSTLHPKITFHNIGANSPGPEPSWLHTSMPALRKWLRHDRIAVLKMDCEGCEYSLAQDILDEDPEFFSRVDQFAMEFHYSRKWLASTTELHGLASLFELLEKAGLRLMHTQMTGCDPKDQASGLLPEFEARMTVMAPGGNFYQKHCHNYLFARL